MGSSLETSLRFTFAAVAHKNMSNKNQHKLTIRGIMIRTAIAAIICAAALNPPPGDSRDNDSWAVMLVIMSVLSWVWFEIVLRSK